jgi:hypothetical protein
MASGRSERTGDLGRERTTTVHIVPAARRRPIALVSDAIGFGGAEVYLATLVAALAGEHDFVAIVGEQTGAQAARRLADAGARVARVPGLGRVPSAPALRRLAATLRAADPAVVHANATDQGDGLSAVLAARAIRRPLAVTVHLAVDGRNARLEDGVQRALGREPRDFTDYARDAAANGAWSGP